MILAVTLILLVLVLAFVGYPLLRPAPVPHEDEPTPIAGQREQLVAEREHALAALTDLEFERGVGNLSEGDYATMRAAQRHKAVAILQELDRLEPASLARAAQRPPHADDLDARLEAEIARIRNSLAGGASAAPPHCPSCGAAHAPTARFCSECGHAFGAAIACPTCGARQARHAAICAECGAVLTQRTHDQ